MIIKKIRNKNCSKAVSALLLLSLIGCLFGQFVSADGGIVIYDRDMWRLQDMKEQVAMINYENGLENMLLSVSVNDFQGEKAVWIFPVPAPPSKTAIDIVTKFPTLRGYELEKKLQQTISRSLTLMAFTQLFPLLPLSMIFVSMGGSRSIDYENVSVYEHMEKMGLTTELVIAKDGNALTGYLSGKGLDLPPTMDSVLSEYAGKDYSFVVSWISDIARFKEQQQYLPGNSGGNINLLGISVIFPTDKIFFPLRTTSVYESQTVPMLVYVMRHVTPGLYQTIEGSTAVSYFVAEDYNVPSELTAFFNQKTNISDLKYTKIKINSPSKYLMDDLWMKDVAPTNIALMFWLNKYFLAFGILLFALISCLASLIAGLMVFDENKISKKKFALFGLWNFLTIIGICVAVKRIGADYFVPSLDEVLKNESFAPNKQSNAFAITFSLVFIAILIVAGIVFADTF